MPRFPDYVAQEGLAVPSAPQIQANTAVGKSLTSLGNTLQEAGQRLAERQRQQTDFDDQIAYQRYTLGQDQALQQAQAGMAPQATGFHDAIMGGRAQADGGFLQTVSPANRDRYAGLLALDRDPAPPSPPPAWSSRGGAPMSRPPSASRPRTWPTRCAPVPTCLSSALNALKAQQASQSSVLPAAREAQWTATKQALQTAGWHGRYGDDPSGQGLAALGVKLSPEDQTVLPLLMDEGPVDPSVDALPPAQRQQLALQWQTNQTQKQAAARADLAGLQQRLDDMMLTGMLDGPPPDRQTFVTAYGPDEGARRFDEAGAFLKDAPAITALLHQPDGA
ncbi:hypothetical protein [Labrys monachus]|uniref:Uncharacterized protein n=1 Tax=Labrys monachus TaxID=217067 RepID=A0ABU0FC45_9HYPH|nr:hypothetical protein [Labrys monachus]MDQ0392188.1 hypothetical protein [Labrys monachus]